jgi:hypothetical protein
MSILSEFPQPITGYILLEGVIVGILLIVFAYIVSFIISKFDLIPPLPYICKTWNINHAMEISLFLTGFLFHLSFEIMGWNKLYAINKVMPKIN